MKSIVINPYDKTIELRELPQDDMAAWNEAKKIIFAQGPHAAGDRHYLQIIQLGAGILMLVDEEGILIDWSAQAFFRLAGENCYAGTAILLGDAREWAPIDDPEKQPDFCACPLPVEALHHPPARLEWIPPELAHYPAVSINGVPIGEPYTFANQPQHAHIDAAVAKAFNGLL